MNFFREWALLTRRHGWVLWAEKSNVLWLFGQVPVIALLIILCFAGFSQEDAALDFFSRFTHHSGLYVAEQEGAGETVVINKVNVASFYDKSATDGEMIGIGTAQRRAAVYYILVCAALWFGMMGSCKEIAGERYVLQRESRTCYGVEAYLASKFTAQVLIVGVQTAMLALVAPFLLDMGWRSTLALILVLWLTAMASAAMGLLLSASCANVRSALTWVPILMIPQFLFGGLLRPLPMASHAAPPIVVQNPAARPGPISMMSSVVSALVVQRWGFDGAMSLDQSFAEGGVLRLRFQWPDVGPDSPAWPPPDLLHVVRDEQCSLADTILPAKTSLDFLAGMHIPWQQRTLAWNRRLLRAVVVLSVMVTVLMGSTYLVLKQRYR